MAQASCAKGTDIHNVRCVTATTGAPPKPAQGEGGGTPRPRQGRNCGGSHLCSTRSPCRGIASQGSQHGTKSSPWIWAGEPGSLSMLTELRSREGRSGRVAQLSLQVLQQRLLALPGPGGHEGVSGGWRKCNRWSHRVSLSLAEFPLGSGDAELKPPAVWTWGRPEVQARWGLARLSEQSHAPPHQ